MVGLPNKFNVIEDVDWIGLCQCCSFFWILHLYVCVNRKESELAMKRAVSSTEPPLIQKEKEGTKIDNVVLKTYSPLRQMKRVLRRKIM